jgi:hypothetical protein
MVARTRLNVTLVVHCLSSELRTLELTVFYFLVQLVMSVDQGRYWVNREGHFRCESVSHWASEWLNESVQKRLRDWTTHQLLRILLRPCVCRPEAANPMLLVFKTLLTYCFCLSVRPFSVSASTVIEIMVIAVNFSMNTRAASRCLLTIWQRKTQHGCRERYALH